MTSNIANAVEAQHSATIPPSMPIVPEIPILDESSPMPNTIIDSNEDATIYPSIRCNGSSVDDASCSVPGTLTQKKKTRGPIIGARLLKHVLLHGRIRVEYHSEMKAANKFVHNKLVRAVGSYIRGKAPMTVSRYGKLSGEFMTGLYSHLSTNFDIDEADSRLHKYLKDMAKNRFKEWKHECRKKWKNEGDGTTKEFAKRDDEWKWLVKHFDDDASKKISRQMTAARRSINKKNHTAGPTLFAHRVNKRKLTRSQAPHLQNFIDVYRKDNPETTGIIEEKMNAAIREFEQSQPLANDGSSDGVRQPIMLPIETEIEIIMEEIPQKQGAIVTGFGPLVHRSPKKRGGSRTTRAEVEEINRRLQEFEEARQQEAEVRRQEDETRRQKDEAQRKEMETHAKEIEELKKANAEREENDCKRMEDMLARVQILLAEKGISGADLMG